MIPVVKERSTDLGGLALAVLAGLASASAGAEPQDQRSVHRKLRAGKPVKVELRVNHPAGAPGEGVACFSLAFPCEAPSPVEIFVDDVEMLRYDARFVDGSLLEEAPRSVCVPTDALDERDHAFRLQAGCGSVVHTAVQVVPTLRRSCAVASIAADRTWYGLGDTITLDIDGLCDGVEVLADFSAVDSGYVAGAEQVLGLGGGAYRVAYPLSAANLRDSGDYPVDVTVRRESDGSRPEKTDTATTRLRYLPNGPPLLHVAGGTYVPDPPPWDVDGDAALSIDGFRASGSPVVPVPDGPEPPDPAVDFGSPGPSAELYGQRVTAFFSWLDGGAAGPPLALELREPGKDGYTRVPVNMGDATCDPASGLCAASADLRLRPTSGATTGSVALDVRLAGGGASSPTSHQDLDLAVPDVPPVFPNYKVRGHIRYQYKESQADLTTPLGSSPQDYPEKLVLTDAPAARANVKIWDSCGHGWSTYTSDEGLFSLEFYSSCGEESANIRVFSFRAPTPRTVSVFKWTNPYETIDVPEDLTADSGDYGVHGYTFSFIPEDGPLASGGQDLGTLTVPSGVVAAKALYIMENVARAVAYFGAWKDPWSFDQINVEYDPTRPMKQDYNVYLPGIHPSLIHIDGNCKGGCSTVTWGWRAFAHAHEVSHYFHRKFLRDNGGSYGRFGEPMANFNAAAILGLEGVNRWSIAANTWVVESMDLNGYADGNAYFKQARMDFFPDTAAAAAACSGATQGGTSCCDVGGGVDGKGDCRMAHSQGWDWRIYYDLHDPTSAQAAEPTYTVYVDGDPGKPVFVQGFDLIDGRGGNNDPADDEMMDVLVNYLGANPANPKYEDRGMSGIDLVDVLDGMVCRGHMTQGTGAKLLNQMMGYGYDFDPPSATCP
jgi:hypothetical protein